MRIIIAGWKRKKGHFKGFVAFSLHLNYIPSNNKQSTAFDIIRLHARVCVSVCFICRKPKKFVSRKKNSVRFEILAIHVLDVFDSSTKLMMSCGKPVEILSEIGMAVISRY